MEVLSSMFLFFTASSNKKHMNEDNEQSLVIVTYFQRGFLYEDILKLLKKKCDLNRCNMSEINTIVLTFFCFKGDSSWKTNVNLCTTETQQLMMIVEWNFWSLFKTPLNLFINQANIRTAWKPNYTNLFSFPTFPYI